MSIKYTVTFYVTLQDPEFTLLDANWMRARPFAGIRTLQCILLKVALVLGVELHTGCEFVSLQFVEAACPCALRAQVLYMYYVRVYEPASI